MYCILWVDTSPNFLDLLSSWPQTLFIVTYTLLIASPRVIPSRRHACPNQPSCPFSLLPTPTHSHRSSVGSAVHREQCERQTHTEHTREHGMWIPTALRKQTALTAWRWRRLPRGAWQRQREERADTQILTTKKGGTIMIYCGSLCRRAYSSSVPPFTTV